MGNVESATTGFLNNSLAVEKVIKGNYAGNTINELVHPTSDALVLFLSKAKTKPDEWITKLPSPQPIIICCH
ncbi:MAG: hypothetical protein WBP88_15020, partial [Nitrososphaeraceae archaeon]